MRLITIEDLRDLYLKLVQRGFSFILSKATFNSVKRTKSSFNEINIDAANWWIIPEIRSRWNKLITGSPDISYEEFISKGIFKDSEALKMVSIGSGVCSHELKLAELNSHWDILCVDFSDNLLDIARKSAKEKNLQNINFVAENIYKYHLPDDYFDIVFFNSSLHHFNQIESFIADKVVRKLKGTGMLIIHEYVGPSRLQYKKNQLIAINDCLKLLDKKYRTMYKSGLRKNRYYGSGLIRMIVSDPTECVDSESILPSIYKNFNIILEKPIGGNILMSVLKDIAHHFVDQDSENIKSLKRLIKFEDDFLLNNPSDFIFGIYQKKSTKELLTP
jgi:ubiquinone/menaquinone biosynthesis C-methylase UbiE